MARSRKKAQEDESFWLGYTDLLSNSLLILLVSIIVAALARASNDRPPLVRLTERESFRFAAGSYAMNSQFEGAMNRRLPEIQGAIKRYRIDTIEVIGHTDGQPSPGSSNLDLLLPKASSSAADLAGYRSGSNADLGLLRALAVANYLRLKLDNRLIIRPYSASSLININGQYAPADALDRADRRRIELRFTRQEEG